MSKLQGEILTLPKMGGNVGAKTINIGEDGATFIPSVSEGGVLSWSNDKDLPNPEPVNIKGDKGEKGDRGDQGERGLQGVQGERGEQGQKGEKGDKGDRGEQGVQGLKGEKGDKGDTGEPGKDGQPGRDGVDGQPGKDGTPGKDGEDGKSAYAYAQDGGYTGSEEQFAEKLAKEPLIGTTNETTSLDVFGALLDGRPVTLLHDGGELGSLLFSNFAYSEMFHAVVASTVVNIGGMSSCVQLFGEVQVLEPKEWQFSVTPIPTQENIQTSVGEALEQAKEGGDFNGEDGFSPVVAVEDIDGGHRVTITDKDGDKAFDVMDGKDGEGGSGGTSVQSDWNVNDENDPAYLKNRPFYSVELPIKFAFGSYTSEPIEEIGGVYANYLYLDPYPSKIPDVVNVNFDRFEYADLPVVYTVLGFPACGNLSKINPLGANYEDTGEPFVLLFIDKGSWVLATNLTHSTTHTFYATIPSETQLQVTAPDLNKLPYAGSGSDSAVFNSNNNVATGTASFAYGIYTAATGIGSCAGGDATLASGTCSHAEGNHSHAEGNNSHAVGRSQHVQGEFNEVDPEYNANTPYARAKYAHIVGNGTTPYDRSNAHTLDWNGLGWFAGGLKVGGTGQDDPNAEDILTKSQVQAMIDEAIRNIPVYNGEVEEV